MQLYHFWPNNKVKQPDETKGLDLKHAALVQCSKIQEELGEVIDALRLDEGASRVLEELADLTQAVEGVQRFFSADQVKSSYRFVEKKCRERGDYDKRGGWQNDR